MVADHSIQPVIFFDGICNLCNGTIQFIIRKDKKKLFLFATLQSEAGNSALKKLKDGQSKLPDSVVLFYKGRYFFKSDAALHIFRLLGGGWQLLYALMIIPRFVRNSIYDLISRNRYKWFGKRDVCMMPTPELMSRFL